MAVGMCKSHIYQPLMLMELLGNGFVWQEAARPKRRAWPAGSWSAWWARFTFNGITRCECCGAGCCSANSAPKGP